MKKAIFFIFVFGLPLSSFANLSAKDFKRLKEEHAQCIEARAESVFSKVSCRNKVDFAGLKREIKFFCDEKMEKSLSRPNSQSELNNQRNLLEATALNAYAFLDRKAEKVQSNCQLAREIKREARQSNVDIKFIEAEGAE